MAVTKIDPKVIFASEAPAQDTPAVFVNKTVGWGESRKNGGRPTIKQSNALQQETDLKILWLNENAVTPYDATIDYPQNAVTIKDGKFKILKDGVWSLFLDKLSIEGLSEVDNTSDLNKPVSTLQQEALNLKADKSNTYTKSEVDTSIASVAGGRKAYQTLALAQSEQTSLPPNTVVDVTNDPISTNNGTYQWNGITLTKSAYDPIEKSKEYTDQEIVNIPAKNTAHDKLLFWIEDAIGKSAQFPRTGIDGLPDEICAKAIFDSIVDKISVKILETLELQGFKVTNSDGFIFQLTDINDVRSWLESTIKGLPSDWSIQCIKQGLIKSGFQAVPTLFKSTYSDAEKKISSGQNITCIGDSLTAYESTGGKTWPTWMQEKLVTLGGGALVRNCGVGGENSVTIAARMGANPFIVSVNSGVISATTADNLINLEAINGQVPAPMKQGYGDPFNPTTDGLYGWLGGVYGKLKGRSNNSYYVFIRSTAGTEVVVDRPQPFYVDYSKQLRGDIAVIWVGQNNGSMGVDGNARAIADTKAIIRHLDALEKKYVVLNKPTSTDAEDAMWFAEFGRHYIPIRKYLSRYGVEDAGLTPTEADNTAKANGTIPPSLTSDGLHYTELAHKVISSVIFNKLKELEYI